MRTPSARHINRLADGGIGNTFLDVRFGTNGHSIAGEICGVAADEWRRRP